MFDLLADVAGHQVQQRTAEAALARHELAEVITSLSGMGPVLAADGL